MSHRFCSARAIWTGSDSQLSVQSYDQEGVEILGGAFCLKQEQHGVGDAACSTTRLLSLRDLSEFEFSIRKSVTFLVYENQAAVLLLSSVPRQSDSHQFLDFRFEWLLGPQATQEHRTQETPRRDRQIPSVGNRRAIDTGLAPDSRACLLCRLCRLESLSVSAS
jgi:hypothetical protein